MAIATGCVPTIRSAYEEDQDDEDGFKALSTALAAAIRGFAFIPSI